MEVKWDQIYSEVAGRPLLYDLFRSSTGSKLPLMIFVHGGGWISGDKTHFREEAHWLATQGFVCACIEYRLAPLHPFPTAVCDVQAFVRYARENAELLGIDPNRIAAMGSSAGGHLACMLALLKESLDQEAPQDISPQVNATVAFCPITDLTAPHDQHLPIAWSFLEQFMVCPYMGNETVWEQASPITHVTSQATPILLIHGDADDIVPLTQSEIFVSALQHVGAEAQLKVMPGQAHGFTLDVWPEVRRTYSDWLREHLLAHRVCG